MAKVVCVIVTYNGALWIERCLESVMQSVHPMDIIVVDNGSNDGTLELISTKFSRARVIRPNENLGFGKGNNVGIRAAIGDNADFVFLLNQDAYLDRDAINNLLETFDRQTQAGLVSPVHFAGDSRNLDFGFYKYVDPKFTPYLLGDIVRGQPLDEYDTEFVNAAAWMIKADAVKDAGVFHPAFDHYGEDREYINRLKGKGYKILINTKAWVIHDRTQSRSGNEFHKYGQMLKRDMLQALIERKITYRQVGFRMLKVIVLNLVTLRIRHAMLTIRNWSWLVSKKGQLHKLD